MFYFDIWDVPINFCFHHYALKCQKNTYVFINPQIPSLCSESMRCTTVLTIIAVFFIVVTLPVSLVFVVKVLITTLIISVTILMLMLTVQVAQEFERAVIYRMGRLLAGGARGPGVFFVVPCVDRFEIVDMRIQTFDIPPQEVATG